MTFTVRIRATRAGLPGQGAAVEERDAVDRFITAWWHTTLTTWPARCDPLHILELLDACGQRIAPRLAGWPADSGDPPTRHLIALVMDLTASTHGGDQFWDDVDDRLSGPVPEAVLTAAAQAGPTVA